MELLESWREKFGTRPHFRNRWPSLPDAESFDNLAADLALFPPVDAADLLCVMVLAFVDLVRRGTPPTMGDSICYQLDMGKKLIRTQESAVELYSQFSSDERIGLYQWLEWLTRSFPEQIPAWAASDALQSWKIRNLPEESGSDSA